MCKLLTHLFPGRGGRGGAKPRGVCRLVGKHVVAGCSRAWLPAWLLSDR